MKHLNIGHNFQVFLYNWSQNYQLLNIYVTL